MPGSLRQARRDAAGEPYAGTKQNVTPFKVKSGATSPKFVLKVCKCVHPNVMRALFCSGPSLWFECVLSYAELTASAVSATTFYAPAHGHPSSGDSLLPRELWHLGQSALGFFFFATV